MNKLSQYFASALIFGIAVSNVSADKIYTCKNSAGKLVYQDSPCPKSSNQLNSKKIDAKRSSGATINRAICRKSIENIHKYLLPKKVKDLTAEEREQLVLKNIDQCINKHTERDYQEILCFSRANSKVAAGLCVRKTK